MVGPARRDRQRKASVPDLLVVRVAKGRVIGQVVVHHDPLGRQGHRAVVLNVKPAGRERSRGRVTRTHDGQVEQSQIGLRSPRAIRECRSCTPGIIVRNGVNGCSVWYSDLGVHVVTTRSDQARSPVISHVTQPGAAEVDVVRGPRGNRHREASIPDLPVVRVAKGRVIGQVVIHHDPLGG